MFSSFPAGGLNAVRLIILPKGFKCVDTVPRVRCQRIRALSGGAKSKEKKPKKLRPDQVGAHRVAYEKNKRKILLTQDTCAICGLPVDKTLKYPHPLSPTVDHIIPVGRGGHPSSIDNLQLAHFTCNRQKWDRILDQKPVEQHKDIISNRILPLSRDWSTYKG